MKMLLLDVRIKNRVLRYGTAIIAVLLAILLRYTLIPLIGRKPEYITVFPAILIVAILAGRYPAVLTGILGSLAAAHLFDPRPLFNTLVEVAWITAAAYLAGWLADRLHTSLAALTESESFYHQTLESIPGFVFTTHPDGYCDYMSRQWADYTGIPQGEQIGDRWNELLHSDDRERAFSAWRAAVEERADYNLEYRIRRYDGHHEWFKVRARPIRCEDGRIIRWFGVAVNIDAFRRTQEDLLNTKNKLEEQKKELEAVIHIVSHDLRAPLVNIRGFREILKDDCAMLHEVLASEHLSENAQKKLDQVFGESAPEAFEMIGISAQAMQYLIDSLIKVARAGLAVPKPTLIDMNTLIGEIIKNVRIKTAEAGATVNVRDLPSCFADRTHVVQIFTNLLDNAIKYLDPNRTGQIRIEGTVEQGHARYCVSDNGIGIAPEHQEKIFEILYRVDGDAGGEGIGLSVVKRMVERNDGRIWVTSEKGKGSHFFVALPLPPTEDTQYNKLQSQPASL